MCRGPAAVYTGLMLKLFRRLARPNLKIMAPAVAAVSLFYFLYVWRLGSLTAGLSATEAASVSASNSLDDILDNPTYAPHKILQLGLKSLFGSSHTSLRLASVILAALFFIFFYLMLAKWFGKLIGLVGCIFLAASPWLIVIGRSATAAIMLLSPVAVLASYYWVARANRSLGLAWLAFSTITALALYVPGLVWILLVSAVISWRALWFHVRRLKKIFLFGGALFFVSAIWPLIDAIRANFEVAKDLALIPSDFGSLADIIMDVVWSTMALFVRFAEHFELIVGRIPILSAMLTLLAIFGAYAMTTMARQKFFTTIGLVVFGILAASFNSNPLFLSFALPPLIIVAAAGSRFLLLKWQAVFPKNPIPRHLAYFLVLSLASFQIYYGVSYALSAWPNTPETRAVYVIK